MDAGSGGKGEVVKRRDGSSRLDRLLHVSVGHEGHLTQVSQGLTYWD
jgi:hypothetical protein